MKPESASGDRVVLVIGGGLAHREAVNDPLLAEIAHLAASPGAEFGEDLGDENGLVRVLLSPLLVMAMAVGFPPTATVPASVPFLVSMMETVPSVWLATYRKFPVGKAHSPGVRCPRGSTPRGRRGEGSRTLKVVAWITVTVPRPAFAGRPTR